MSTDANRADSGLSLVLQPVESRAAMHSAAVHGSFTGALAWRDLLVLAAWGVARVITRTDRRKEKMLREMESATGSGVGATGALYAVRRSLLVPVPPETILDDVFLPMRVVRQGFRVVFDPRARVWDLPDMGTEKEFARKVRTLTGNYQLLQLEPWLLSRANPIRFEFVSHKLLRLVVPFALCAALASSCLLPAPIYRIALFGQLGFYGLSAWALVRLKHDPLARFADAAFTFVLLNTAAVVAFANFVIGRKAAWVR